MCVDVFGFYFENKVGGGNICIQLWRLLYLKSSSRSLPPMSISSSSSSSTTAVVVDFSETGDATIRVNLVVLVVSVFAAIDLLLLRVSDDDLVAAERRVGTTMWDDLDNEPFQDALFLTILGASLPPPPPAHFPPVGRRRPYVWIRLGAW